jgi:hypothetical protein
VSVSYSACCETRQATIEWLVETATLLDAFLAEVGRNGERRYRRQGEAGRVVLVGCHLTTPHKLQAEARLGKPLPGTARASRPSANGRPRPVGLMR